MFLFFSVDDMVKLLDTVRYLELSNTALKANHSYNQELARLQAEADLSEAQQRNLEGQLLTMLSGVWQSSSRKMLKVKA